jgi:hypothetical protein
MPELTPPELTADLIAWSRDEPYPDSDEHPVWRWERWIRDDPEPAWQVFEELARQAPDDVEVIERVAQRLEQIVFRHRADFLERAIRLVRSTPLLDRMFGPEVFTEGSWTSIEAARSARRPSFPARARTRRACRPATHRTARNPGGGSHRASQRAMCHPEGIDSCR